MAGFGSLGSSRRSCLDCNPFSLNFCCVQLIMLLRGSFSSKIQNATAQKAKNQAFPSQKKTFRKKNYLEKYFHLWKFETSQFIESENCEIRITRPNPNPILETSIFLNNLVTTATTGS